MTNEIKVNGYTYTFRSYDRDLGKTIIISKYRPHEYTACKWVYIPVNLAIRFYDWLKNKI